MRGAYQNQKSAVASHCWRLLPKRFTGLAIAALTAMATLGTPGEATAQTRTLELYNTHTKERASITFRRNGRYDSKGVAKLNHFLRDWRRNESTKMDPKLFDLLWEVHRETGSKSPIHVVSGFRSPVTNAALRRRSRGVARNSQHTQGRATDFFIPGVSSSKIRKIALKKQVGGVGFYPSANTPFVHLDTAGVRAWPRMTRKQLLALFPDGKTLHLPSDGKPLKGYAEAARLEKAGRLEQLNSRAGDRRRPRNSETRVARVEGEGNRGLLGNLLRGGQNSGQQDAAPNRTSNRSQEARTSNASAAARRAATTTNARPAGPTPVPAARPAVSRALPAPAAPEQPVEEAPAAAPEPTPTAPAAPEIPEAPAPDLLIADAPLPEIRPAAIIAEATGVSGEQTLAEAAAEENETVVASAETDLVITQPAPRPSRPATSPGTGEIIVANLPDQVGNASGAPGENEAAIAAAYARAGIERGGNILADPIAGIIRGGLPLSELGTPDEPRATTQRPRQQPNRTIPGKPRRLFPTEMVGSLVRAEPKPMTASFASRTGDTRHFVHPTAQGDGFLSVTSDMIVVSYFGKTAPTPAIGAFEGPSIKPLAVKRIKAPAKRQAGLVNRLFSSN